MKRSMLKRSGRSNHSGLRLKRRIKKFVRKHPYIVIALICYVVVMIMSVLYSPWQAENPELDSMIDSSKTLTQTLVLKILFFGIYDLYGLMECPLLPTDDDILMFGLAACAIFFYQKLLIDKLLIGRFMKDVSVSWFEEAVMAFLADNVFAYISSLLLYFNYMPMARSVSEICAEVTLASLLVMIAVAVLVILPSFVYLFYLLVYLVCFDMSINLLVYIDQSLAWYPIFKALLLVLISIALAVGIDLLINGLIKGVFKLVIAFIKDRFDSINKFC